MLRETPTGTWKTEATSAQLQAEKRRQAAAAAASRARLGPWVETPQRRAAALRHQQWAVRAWASAKARADAPLDPIAEGVKISSGLLKQYGERFNGQPNNSREARDAGFIVIDWAGPHNPLFRFRDHIKFEPVTVAGGQHLAVKDSNFYFKAPPRFKEIPRGALLLGIYDFEKKERALINTQANLDDFIRDRLSYYSTPTGKPPFKPFLAILYTGPIRYGRALLHASEEEMRARQLAAKKARGQQRKSRSGRRLQCTIEFM